jgi:tetratricopeptide (TPR) repeat protein
LITRFPKIGGFWIDYGTLFRTVFDDIQSILSRSSSWSNVELIDRCYTQTQIKPSSWPSVSLDLPNVEKYSNLNKEIRFVVLHCDNLVLFHMDSQRFHLSQFSDVAKCVEYLESSDIKSLFFIISGEMKSIRHDLKKITALNQIYAIYLFIPSVDQQEFDETLCSYQNIGRVFDNLDFLLTCLISDIKFYLEQPLYRPSLSIFRIKNNKDDNGELRFRDEQNKFAAFQIFISTLREAPASICRNQNLYSRCFTLVEDKSDGEHALGILKTETNKIFDWFIDAPFLSVIINSFCQEQFPQNLLDIQQVLMIIDQHFAKLSPTTSSSVVYRVQLISNEDLKLIKENVKELVAFHAYLLATKDLLTARMIARQAADRGLLIIILQIEIPAQAYVLEVDNNRLMFRFGSIFSIRSIDSGPDGVWYAQLKYTDSDFQSVQKQLQLQTGTQLTWLTLGKCLRTLNHFNEGKFYYDYLVNALPKTHQALPSIFNNMGLMLSESGDDKNAIQCLNTAVNLLNKISPITKRTTERTPLKTLSQSDETKIIIDHCTVYDKMAEVYLHQLEHDKALKCYRMALELATDPLSRVRFEQKIKNILLHPKSSN